MSDPKQPLQRQSEAAFERWIGDSRSDCGLKGAWDAGIAFAATHEPGAPSDWDKGWNTAKEMAARIAETPGGWGNIAEAIRAMVKP